MSQTDRLLKYFKRGGKLTVVKAIGTLGIYALSQRCGDLRVLGYPIKSRWVVVGNARVKEYWMDKNN